MLRSITIIFSIIFHGALFSQSTGGTVHYHIQAHPGQESFAEFLTRTQGSDPNIEKSLKMATAMEETERVLRFTLRFTTKGAIFRADEGLVSEEAEVQHLLTKSTLGLNGSYVQVEDYVINQVENNGRVLNLRETPAIQWQIVGDTSRVLLNRTCYLARGQYATLDRQGHPKSQPVAVWFDPTLPFPYGPKQFRDLPGLVLAVSLNGAKELVATELKVGPTEPLDLSLLRQGKTVERDDYLSSLSNRF